MTATRTRRDSFDRTEVWAPAAPIGDADVTFHATFARAIEALS